MLSRDVPVEPARTALIIIDVQNYTCHPEGTIRRGLSAEERAARTWFHAQLEAVTLPNLQRLQAACRRARVEVIYTVIESLTADGRDRSLDYKISGLHVPRGAWDAKVLDAIAPAPDEIILPKTSSSVFISTNIDYVLRNLGVQYVMIAGLLTDQCVDSAIRDACDLGYLVSCPTDACLRHTEERQAWSLRNNRGYCRQVMTDALVAEIAAGG